MVICISNKQACLPSSVQFGSHLSPLMYGNHCHFSKRSQMLHVLCILIEKQCVWWSCSICPHHYVVQLLTSHQISLFCFWYNPAWIIIALALPIKVGIFLSTTEFCWGVPGAVYSKILPDFVCHTLSGDFCFLHCCQA